MFFVHAVCVSQNRVIICKFPQKYLFLTGGSTFLQAISDARGLSRLGLFCIYGAPFGANYLQKVEHRVRRLLASVQSCGMLHVEMKTF